MTKLLHILYMLSSQGTDQMTPQTTGLLQLNCGSGSTFIFSTTLMTPPPSSNSSSFHCHLLHHLPQGGDLLLPVGLLHQCVSQFNQKAINLLQQRLCFHNTYRNMSTLPQFAKLFSLEGFPQYGICNSYHWK